MVLKVLDLFSGIGGFSLGLERAGMKTVAFCEIDKFCQKVLKKHWPDVPIYEDVKKICRWTWKDSKAQTLLRQAFLVRIYHTQEKVPEFPGNVLDYGGKCAVAFAWYDHASRIWRTWQRCLIEGWAPYSEAWPRSGMTRNGIAYRLQPLAVLSREIGSGFCATLTTMDSLPAKSEKALLREKMVTRKGRTRPANLRDQLANMENWKMLKLPTMGANEYKGSSRKRYKGSKHFRGAKTSEALRTCEAEPIYLHPCFAEMIMGYQIGYTELKRLEIP